MSVLGTFGSFGIARLAIYASSSALSVTGNNISNINTEGYCRQYLSTSALYVAGTDQLASGGSLNFGSGVSTDAIHQYRDIYMDIRYRDEATRVGQAETKLDGLQDLAHILDEVASGDSGFGVLEAQFSQIVEQLQLLSEMTGSEEYDTLVRSACETLVKLFNSYSDKLENVADNTYDEFNANINDTNILLTNIRDLNEQIRNSEIYGDMALTLRDQRNLYVDELSNLIGIDVIYSSEEIGLGLSVEHMTIKIAGTDIDLVDGIYCTQINMQETVEMINPYISDNGVTYFDEDLISNYMYVDYDGNPTNFPDQATAWLNPDWPYADDPENNNRWLSPFGVPVSNAVLAGPQLNPYYWDSEAGVLNGDAYTLPSSVNDAATDPLNEAGGWLGGQFAVGEWDEETGDWKKNPDGSYYVAFTTNDPNYEVLGADGETVETSVIRINNNVEDDYDNAYQLTLSPLISSRGYYEKDQYNRDITCSITLNDTVLSGALQGYRELLTEEGEFSSSLDIAMDENATVKYGIPYYRMAVDALAKQFAETFNTINNLNPQDIFAVSDKGEFLDKNKLLLNDDGTVMLDANGNPLYDFMRDDDGNIITIDNMYDVGDSGLTKYEEYIYDNGVRNPNYLKDSDGNYLQEEMINGELCYVPILVETVGGNPVYLTAGNLTPEWLEELEDIGITQDLYAPDAMFSYDGTEDEFLDKNGNAILYDFGDGNGLTPIKLEDAMTDPAVFDFLMENGVLTDDYSNFLKSGNLFSNSTNSNDDTNITAGNISVSRDWSIGEVRIVLAKGENVGSSDNSNVLKFVAAMDAPMSFKANDVATDAWEVKNEFFIGSFQEMFTNTTSTLAQDMNTTTSLLVSYETSALNLYNSRLSVSGVDLNEEATNMMQYQKSYTAAAKLMTTLDEVLQTLLNM